MRTKFLRALIIVTIIIGGILFFAGLNPMMALVGGGLIWFMVRVLWSPPPKHKVFSDVDRLDATYQGVGGPPELPQPDLPEEKDHKHKDE